MPQVLCVYVFLNVLLYRNMKETDKKQFHWFLKRNICIWLKFPKYYFFYSINKYIPRTCSLWLSFLAAVGDSTVRVWLGCICMCECAYVYRFPCVLMCLYRFVYVCVCRLIYVYVCGFVCVCVFMPVTTGCHWWLCLSHPWLCRLWEAQESCLIDFQCSATEQGG